MKINYFKTYPISDLRDMLCKSAKKHSNKTAFRLKNENGKIYSITYSKFKNDVEALCTKFVQMGLLNKKICVIGKNSYSWSVSYLAATICGIVVPIDKELHNDDIINFINVSESFALVGDSKFLDALSLQRDKIKISISYI